MQEDASHAEESAYVADYIRQFIHFDETSIIPSTIGGKRGRSPEGYHTRFLEVNPLLVLVDGVSRYPFRTECMDKEDKTGPRRVVIPDYLRVEVSSEKETIPSAWNVFHGNTLIGYIDFNEKGNQMLYAATNVRFLKGEDFGTGKDLKVGL